jgi:hypothetical protein
LGGVGLLAMGVVVGRCALPPGDLMGRPVEAPAATVVERPVPRRWEATVYLPLSDNQGRPFAEAMWHEALGRFVTPFGGATLGLLQEGCWLDARGRLQREWVRPVVVSFAPQRLDEFRQAVHDVGRLLDQEAMYVRFEEPRVELVPVARALAAGNS